MKKVKMSFKRLFCEDCGNEENFCKETLITKTETILETTMNGNIDDLEEEVIDEDDEVNREEERCWYCESCDSESVIEYNTKEQLEVLKKEFFMKEI